MRLPFPPLPPALGANHKARMSLVLLMTGYRAEVPMTHSSGLSPLLERLAVLRETLY